ncbi:MAG: hypothetical protein Q7U67_10030 [Hydrogenophaga sp.]|nr:hypothetical protein [Hydrogenophaga sp.]
MDWASAVLAQPMEIRGGKATAPDAPGTGIDWDEAAVERYVVR